jgi:hypothetical protein
MTTSAPPITASPTASAPAGLSAALDQAREALARVRAVVTSQAVQALDERGLLDAQGAMTGLRREGELVMAALCAEIARRSSLDQGSQGLSRKQGFTTPASMIAAATGGSRRDAEQLIRAGQTIADAEAQARREEAGESTASEDDEPSYAWVAAALTGGELSVQHAAQITRMLDAVASGVTAEQVIVAERALVGKAPGLTVEQFTPVVARWRHALMEKDAEARQDRLNRERYLVFTDLPDGAVKLDGRLDPVTAAPIRAALEGMVKDAFRRRRDGDPLAEDRRSNGQVRADALAILARHMLGCDDAPVHHATTKVVVRMTLEQLVEGAGVAHVDGSAAIPASQVRTAAVDAGYIPVVLGGESLPLDVGRTKRRFTQGQVTGLLERDGGCAMCGAPPSHCEAHHIDWWDRDGGRTDLSNGVMLCVACHHTVHRDRWEIDASNDEVWFRPPESIDAHRAPRLGGVARFGVSRRERGDLERAASPPDQGGVANPPPRDPLPSDPLPRDLPAPSDLPPPRDPPPPRAAWMTDSPAPEWATAATTRPSDLPAAATPAGY